MSFETFDLPFWVEDFELVGLGEQEVVFGGVDEVGEVEQEDVEVTAQEAGGCESVERIKRTDASIFVIHSCFLGCLQGISRGG